MSLSQYSDDLPSTGGIGQGGAMALHMAYRYAPGIAGVFAFGSYLNDDSAVYTVMQFLNY